MATAAEIAAVRLNTDEPTEAVYTDEDITDLVGSEGGVVQASAAIWRQKAARWASMVNTSAEGASYSFGDRARNALAMAKDFDSRVVVAATSTGGGVRSRAITR